MHFLSWHHFVQLFSNPVLTYIHETINLTERAILPQTFGVKWSIQKGIYIAYILHMKKIVIIINEL